MRHSLFVSSLFAASLVTGAALADNHHPVEFGRAHGDTFEKTYKTVATHDARGGSVADRTAAGSRSPAQTKQNERVNCSSEGADCAASHGSAAHATVHESAKAGSARSAPSAISAKGSDRVACNEAGEGCQMSSKAAKAGAGKSHASPTDATPMAQAAMAAVDRKMNQAYAARMSCNEGDECSMSSKDAKKIWRTEAFKHGSINQTSKALDFSNAHADLKSRMEAARFRSNTERTTKK